MDSSHIVDERLDELLRLERSCLEDLRVLLESAHSDEERLRQLRGLIQHLDELFLLVIIGEVKAGKSSFINALVGSKVCKEGAIPVTDKVHILKWGETERERILSDFLIERHFPFDALKTLHIVDTPGTNSIVRQHQEITEDFIPRCDLVLFTTSADRPFTDTERSFLELIADGWGRKIVFIVTKVDIKDPHEVDEVVTFVRDCGRKFFNQEFKVFPVSARHAFQAKQEGNAELLRSSGFEALERYLFEELNQGEKLSIKMNAPIDAGLKICAQTEQEFTGRLELLKRDSDVVDAIESQLKQSETDLNENYGRFLLEADNVLFEFEKRARDWIDDSVKLTNFGLLRDAERFRDAFAHQVVKDFDMRLEQVIHHAVDWFTKRNLKIWQDTLEYFNDKVGQHQRDGRVIGKVGTQFQYNREEIFESVRAKASEAVRNFDRDSQVRRMVDRLSTALSLTLGISIAAVGGAVLTVAIASGWWDVTGIVAAISVIGLSMLVLPAKRRSIKADFSSKIAQLRQALNQVMRKQIEEEAREAIEKVREVLQPYTDFCKRERTSIRSRLDELESMKGRLLDIKSRLKDVVKV